MTTRVRRVVLHAGVGKTGSSALQTAFVRHRAELASYGVRYPEHASDEVARNGGVTSGNGGPLRRWLVPRDTAPRGLGARIRAEVEAELRSAPAHTLLYSSEFLYLAGPDRLERLRRDVAGHGATLQVVVYLRDLAGHAVSSYSQVVKRGLFTGTLADYLAPGTAGGYHLPLERVLALPGLLGEGNVTVLHYDTERHHLVQHFCATVLGVDLDPRGDAVRGGAVVNRSFTAEELDLMRRLNRVLTTRTQARRVSDVLIGLPPLGSTRPTATADDLETLRRAYGDQVDRVNETFFGGPVLSVAGATDGVPPTAAAPEDTVAPTRREQHLLDAIARLASD